MILFSSQYKPPYVERTQQLYWITVLKDLEEFI